MNVAKLWKRCSGKRGIISKLGSLTRWGWLMNKYSRTDLNAAMNAQTQKMTLEQKVYMLEAKISQLESEKEWLRMQMKSQTEYTNHLQRQILEEQRTANELHTILQQRKEFDQWLKDVYPEAIAQYKAAMDLVKFMEDEPKPEPKSGYQWGWNTGIGGKSILQQQYQNAIELEIEKLKAGK